MFKLSASVIFCVYAVSLSCAWPVNYGEGDVSAASIEVTTDPIPGEYAEVSDESQAERSQSSGLLKLSLVPTPVKTAESVNLEHEGIPSKILSTYDNSQKKLLQFTNPTPIVDSISEHEKYGNDGDMFAGISRSLVNGYEAFSNFLNHLITKPQQFARSISKSITSQLDVIGGKLVGL